MIVCTAVGVHGEIGFVVRAVFVLFELITPIGECGQCADGLDELQQER